MVLQRNHSPVNCFIDMFFFCCFVSANEIIKKYIQISSGVAPFQWAAAPICIRSFISLLSWKRKWEFSKIWCLREAPTVKWSDPRPASSPRTRSVTRCVSSVLNKWWPLWFLGSDCQVKYTVLKVLKYHFVQQGTDSTEHSWHFKQSNHIQDFNLRKHSDPEANLYWIYFNNG